MPAQPDNRLLAWFERHFDAGLPFTRFARNVILLSLAGLMPPLALFIALTPGFAAHLIGTDAALARLLRQILTNGLPVVFAINALSFILFAQASQRETAPTTAPAPGAGTMLAYDFLARTGLFIALHAVIYAGSAIMFGSFGADPGQALRIVGPTLVQAAGFGNLSGVYLYATLISALPLQLALAERMLRGDAREAPAPIAPLALALGVIAAQFAALTLAAMMLARLMPPSI